MQEGDLLKYIWLIKESPVDLGCLAQSLNNHHFVRILQFCPGHYNFTNDTALDSRSSGIFDPNNPDTSAIVLIEKWITSASAFSYRQLPRLKFCVGTSRAFTKLLAGLEFRLLCWRDWTQNVQKCPDKKYRSVQECWIATEKTNIYRTPKNGS